MHVYRRNGNLMTSINRLVARRDTSYGLNQRYACLFFI